MVNVPNEIERELIKQLIDRMVRVQLESGLPPLSCLIATHAMNCMLHAAATHGKSNERIEQIDLLMEYSAGFAVSLTKEVMENQK
jgi:hypothetical protein